MLSYMRLILGCAAVAGCATSPNPNESAPSDPASQGSDPAEAAAPTEETQVPQPAGEERAFGQPLSPTPPIPLASITGDPARFAGQTVKTEGTITQVCQRMGCWMELQAEGTPPVRVPMAGHRFFLPRDVSGRLATIEGTVNLRELSEAERAHLESEGATATGRAMEIVAAGVVVR